MSRDQSAPAPLFVAARAGSRTALGELFEGCRQYLLLVGNQELGKDLSAKGGASDLVQETFLEAQRDFSQFSGNTLDELRAWLRTVLLHNIAGFERRFCQTEKRQIEREVPLELNGRPEHFAELLSNDTTGPTEAAIRREDREILARAVAALSEEHGLVLRLRHQERMTFRDIGRQMNRSADAARMLWCRACERLALELEGSHGQH